LQYCESKLKSHLLDIIKYKIINYCHHKSMSVLQIRCFIDKYR